MDLSDILGPNRDDECCPWCGTPLDDPTIGDFDMNMDAHATDDPCEGLLMEIGR